MFHNIKNGAIFIADAHYNQKNQQLKQLLLQIKSQEIIPTQLFLMGDIFDFLSSQITYFINQNQDMIELINELSNNIEIFYFEGNHDFNLQSLFPNITIFPREKQPVTFEYDGKKVALAHGDIFTPFGYEVYTKVIRNTLVQNILNVCDINNFISKKVDNWLLSKHICNSCNEQDKFIDGRLSYYGKDNDLVIEGHFHFAIISNGYINLPSLTCTLQYAKVDADKFYFIHI